MGWPSTAGWCVVAASLMGGSQQPNYSAIEIIGWIYITLQEKLGYLISNKLNLILL